MNKKFYLTTILVFLFIVPSIFAAESIFSLLGNVFEDITSPGSLLSKILSIPGGGNETVYKLALWVVLFVVFFYLGTSTIFTKPESRKVAGFIAAFIALIAAWFFDIEQLKNLGVVYATLIFFAFYLIPVALFLYLMYGKWGENDTNPLEEPTTMNFALKALLTGLILWLLGTLAKAANIGSFTGSTRTTIASVFYVEPWVKDITAYFFAILFFMFLYYIIRLILSLFGGFGGGASEGERRIARGAGAGARLAGRGIASGLGSIGRGTGSLARGALNRVRRAEQQTQEELAGIRESESEIEDIPVLIERLRNPRNSKEVNESARKLLEIIHSLGQKERKNLVKISDSLQQPLAFIRKFIENITRDQVIEKLQHIQSVKERFNSYPHDIKQQIISIINVLPSLLQRTNDLNEYFIQSFGQRTGRYQSTVKILESFLPKIEEELRHSHIDAIEKQLGEIAQIMKSLESMSQELVQKDRELKSLIGEIQAVYEIINHINESISKIHTHEKEEDYSI